MLSAGVLAAVLHSAAALETAPLWHAKCIGLPQPGVCFTGVPGYTRTRAGTPSDCCGACTADAHCASWTWDSAVSGGCHLKGAAPNATGRSPGESCTSGIVRADPTPGPAPIPPGPPGPPPAPVKPAPKGALNVMFIVIDDLRPEFNAAYGQKFLVTPNLDRFKESALTFKRAYVQYSHCSPSRNSFLSGRSPQTTAVYNFIDHFREEGVGVDWVAMPQFFKENGWYVAGGGKVYHPNHPPHDDTPKSWTTYFKANGDDGGCRKNETIYSNVCPSEQPYSEFYDWQLANDTVAQMRLAKGLDQPFWIAAGLRRPHRLWHVPKHFYDLYENNGSHPTNMPLAEHKTGPVGMPPLAFIDNAWPSFAYNQSVPIDDEIAAWGRWGYYASVSFTDYNVGLILDGIDTLGLAQNTVVLFTGDQ
jgi:iduronate 2-sulfatase